MTFLKKRHFWIVLLIFSFTLTGCYSITVEKHVNIDGSGRMITTYDFTELMQLESGEDADEMEGFEAPNLEEMCQEFYEGDLVLTYRDCIIDGYAVTFSGDIPQGTINIIDEGDTYTYYLKDVYELMTPISEDDESDEINDEEILEMEPLKQMGVQMNLRVVFEGEIIEADLGNYENNVIDIDFFELAKTENPAVRVQKTQGTDTMPDDDLDTGADDADEIVMMPEEEKNNNTIIIVIIGLLIVGLAVFLVMRMKKKPNNETPKQTINTTTAPKEESIQQMNEQPQNFQSGFGQESKTSENEEKPSQEITPKIQHVIDWIRKYEQEYSEDAMRKKLEENPTVTKEEIEIAFKNK